MKLWIMATAIALFMEGIFLGLSPKLWRRTMEDLQKLPDQIIQRIGLALCCGALLVMWLVR